MELESSCLLCKKSVAKKSPLHSVNNLHLITILVGLLDDIVDNSVDKTVLPKNSRVCPSCFRSLEKLRQDLYDLKNIKRTGKGCLQSRTAGRNKFNKG